jgi:hypothetical protein
MRVLMMMVAFAAGPAQAYELWCMPTEVCHGKACEPNSDEERSVRITDPDGPKAMMRAFAEDVPMTQTTEDNDIFRWTGTNQYGISMILDLDATDMSYTMTASLSGNDDSLYTGTCEVQ